ncbi:DUF3298 and DUF4163 domain-containing protein [Edaphobacillus lindanitolerans]|uniref:DUF3298 domain-containing protein n=1 Tax=Edaphobacillus lindanitolerans TaxID=550447 RepID=A0A1U7PNF7_9BACI|nr:DUF3298 and DUF4163 domain-containing protein [Edaphobacillus lindanitolerans]SIT84497.1 protein of unknown function [Edaphobacillus lindanitolerans]
MPVTIVSHPIRLSRPKVDVVYPQVTGLANPSAQTRINRTIITTLTELMKELGYGNDNLVEMSGYYEMKTNERGILSLLLVVYSFTGGAHGLTLAKGLTFDVHTGRMFRLKDLFAPGTDYTALLSAKVEELIKEWNLDLLEPFKGISPEQDFYIADHSLTLFFQLYEITAYVYGFPYFPIPLRSLESIIGDDSPVEKLIAF